MAKKFTVSSENLKPDPVFKSRLVSKFINCMMYDGKKSRAQAAFYDALKIIEKKNQDARPIEVFEKAINNVKPMIEVRSKRVGGASYQVPMQISTKRQQSLAFRWILLSARGKKGKPMAERLAGEIINAYKKEGDAITKRENVHKMAEANKLFAHFAW